MNLIETTSEAAEKNFPAFRNFLLNLRNPVYIGEREVLIGANVIYYQHKKMHHFTAAVVLIRRGPDEGLIRIVQRDLEGVDMDMSLSVTEGVYAQGRSADVLTIGNISGKTTRIDLAENPMLMKGVN